MSLDRLIYVPRKTKGSPIHVLHVYTHVSNFILLQLAMYVRAVYYYMVV
jgi:hypothetical protein